MRRSTLGIFALVALVGISSTAFGAMMPGSQFRYNLWNGAGYTYDKTGKFSHCAVGSTYVNGISMSLAVQPSGSVTIVFARPEWSFTPGQEIDGTLQIDQRYSVHARAIAVQPKILKIDFLVTDPIFGHLEHGYTLTIISSIGNAAFNLKDSYRALQLAKQCTRKYLAKLGNPPQQVIPATQNWLARNPWFLDPRFAEQRRAVMAINNQMIAQGMDVTTASFYEELDRRIRQAGIQVPEGHSFNQMMGPIPTPTPAVVAPKPQPKPTPKLVPVSGSGVIISTEGYVVTNEHVIDGCVSKIYGALPGQQPIALRVVNTDQVNDLALLKAPTPFGGSASMRGRAIRPGDAITAIGYPYPEMLSSEFTITTGVISSLGGLGDDSRYFQISAAVQPGNSGGPLLDNNGDVVGIVSAKLDATKMLKATGSIPENINFAIKTGVLRDFLDKNVVNYQTNESSRELQTAQIAAMARHYAMRIACQVESAE